MKAQTKKGIAIGLAIVLLAAILAALFFTGIIKINTPSAEQYPVRGVDVSEYQGNIHWPTIEQNGMQFAFIKATEGSSYADPFFQSNWENIAETGIIRGAYHFFSFDSSAKTQAENFIATVDKQAGMLPPTVDIEFYGQYKNAPPSAAKVRAELTLLLNMLEKHYGKKPIIYATRQSYALYIKGYYPEYPLWIRDVFFTPPAGEWTFWQYTDKGSLPGYDGPEKFIDINAFAGDLAALEKLCLA